MDNQKTYKEKITKETAIDIILWAKEQKHIRGDVDLVIQTIMKQEEEK